MATPAQTKAAAAIATASKAYTKTRSECLARRKMIDSLLTTARDLDAQAVVEKILHLRSYGDRFRAAVRESLDLLDGIDMTTAEDNAIENFLTELKTPQGRIDTSADLYKGMKRKVLAQLKGQEEAFGVNVVKWLKGDKLGEEALAKQYKLVKVAVNKALKAPAVAE